MPPRSARRFSPAAHRGAAVVPFKSSVLGRAQTGRNTGVESVIALQQHFMWLQSAHIQDLPCESDSSTSVTIFVWMLLSSTRESYAFAGIAASVNTTAKSRMMLRQARTKRFTVNPLAPSIPNANVFNTLRLYEKPDAILTVTLPIYKASECRFYLEMRLSPVDLLGHCRRGCA